MRRSLEMYRGLPKDIYVLFLAQIVNSLGNFVYPFLTLLLTEKAGMTAADAGTYVMIAAIAFIPGAMLGGKLADTIGRKRMIVTGFFVVATTFIACGAVNDMHLLPWFIVVAEIAMGMIHPTIHALTTDLTRPENRQPAFSLLYLGHNIGFAIGPLIAGFLFNRNVPLMFFGDAGTSIVAVILVVLWVRESRPDTVELERIRREQPAEADEEGSIVHVLGRRPLLIVFMFAALIASFVYAQYTFALPLYLSDVFGDRGPEIFGMVMTANAVVVVVGTAPIVAMTRRRLPVSNVALSSFLYMVGFGVLFLGGGVGFFLATTVVWTTGEILSATNVEVFIANHTPAGHRGRMNAITPILIGSGFAVGPMLAGRFIEAHGTRMIWPIAAVMAAVSATILVVLRFADRRGAGVSIGSTRPA